VLDETGLVEHYQIEGTSPMFGNNDKGVDQSATSVVGAVSTLPTLRTSCTARCISSSPGADENWTQSIATSVEPEKE